MNWLSLGYALLAAVAGGFIALQAITNTKLRGSLGICGTFVTACGLMLAFVAVWRPPAPTADAVRDTEWWYWIGGPLGAFFVLAGAVLVRELGAAAYLALAVAGQLALALVFDHYGLMGLAVAPISWQRILGVALVVLGVVCIKYL
jgi:bacterial/archaeal transporter family-2 protein